MHRLILFYLSYHNISDNIAWDRPGDDKAGRFAADCLLISSSFSALPQDAEKGCILIRGTPCRLFNWLRLLMGLFTLKTLLNF